MLQTVLRYKGRILELAVDESEEFPAIRRIQGRGVYVLTARLWWPGQRESRVLMKELTGLTCINFNEVGALVNFVRLVTNWLDGIGGLAAMLPPPPLPYHPVAVNQSATDASNGTALVIRRVAQCQRHSGFAEPYGRSIGLRNGETPMHTTHKIGSNLSKNGKTLRSIAGRCIVCQRANVPLHPYTSLRNRLFCHRCHAIAEAVRMEGYSQSTGYRTTTVFVSEYLDLVTWLEGRLNVNDIAKLLIYIGYGASAILCANPRSRP